MIFIGAETFEWQLDFCQCLYNEGGLEDEIIIEIESPADDCEIEGYDCNIVYNFLPLVLPNDGVVVAASAANVPGLTASYNMVGSNHFSMRNDFNTELALQKLFNGEFCDFFFTDLR